MLIQKGVTEGDVVAMKLSNGEELIAKVTAITETGMQISKPMQVNLGMDERTRQVGVQMLPYFMLTADPDAKIEIKNQHIMAITTASEQAKAGYIKNTTGLTLATASSLVK